MANQGGRGRGGGGGGGGRGGGGGQRRSAVFVCAAGAVGGRLPRVPLISYTHSDPYPPQHTCVPSPPAYNTIQKPGERGATATAIQHSIGTHCGSPARIQARAATITSSEGHRWGGAQQLNHTTSCLCICTLSMGYKVRCTLLQQQSLPPLIQSCMSSGLCRHMGCRGVTR